MLALLLTTCIVCPAQQEPQLASASASASASAMEVRGDTELTPADALASAELRVEEHVRTLWHERAERAASRQSPCWMPDVLTDRVVKRWLAELPVERLVKQVHRDDRERVHEFGHSYQTTLWVAEDKELVQHGERRLRSELRRLERTTAVKAGGIAAGWIGLALLLGWLDRLSRGYMTGRLRAIGILGGVLMPTALFLV